MSPAVMPFHKMMSWSPFRLDALGLVTLIGAEEVNRAVGRLVSSKYTTFIPLLGQYLISGNQFTNSVPGFCLYNLTDAFTTTSLSGWFCRWLKSQELMTSTTAFQCTVLSKDQRARDNPTPALGIGCFIISSMVVLSILMSDWWGVANSIALGASVYIRWFVVRENSMSLDASCDIVCDTKTSYNTTPVKLLITLDDGKLVTIYAPRGLVMSGFLKKPTPVHHSIYTWTRGFGWLFFGIHIIALGQCNLTTQIVAVTVLITSTWLVVSGFGCNEFVIGKAIRVKNLESTIRVADRRLWAFARLGPTSDEEECLINWNFLPRKINTAWWEEYSIAKKTLELQGTEPLESSSASPRDSSELPGYPQLFEAESPAEYV